MYWGAVQGAIKTPSLLFDERFYTQKTEDLPRQARDKVVLGKS
jgi:hypothetical protein